MNNFTLISNFSNGDHSPDIAHFKFKRNGEHAHPEYAFNDSMQILGEERANIQ